MSEDRRGDWISTYVTGTRFYPLDPRPEDVHVEDIAHALSQVNRFTGHTKFPYSVAAHSINVSRCVSPANALWGLLHDAAEAYISDLARPLKRLPEFSAFREVETLIMRAVCARFGLPVDEPQEVTQADKALLWAEANALLRPGGRELGPAWQKWREFEVPPYGDVPPIVERQPSYVRGQFLDRFYGLYVGRQVA